MDIYYEIGLTVDGKSGVLHLDNKFTHIYDTTSALKWVIETILDSNPHANIEVDFVKEYKPTIH
jgi:hypothetical protein